MRPLDFIIIGEPKSGTTALHSWLNQHPQIYMSAQKEPGYFCRDFHKESDAFHRSKKWYHVRNEQRYSELFANAKSNQLIGESSTVYLASTDAAKEIHKHSPKVKLIAFFREPSDFLYSYYLQMFSYMHETEPDFWHALDLETSRRSGKNIPSTVGCPSYLYYSEKVLYSKKLKRFLDVFGKDQLMLICYEDFKKDNAAVFKDILEFIGADTSFSPKFTTVNTTTKPLFKSLRTFVRNNRFAQNIIYNMPVNWLGYFNFILKEILSRKIKKLPLDTDKKNNLKAQYRPEAVKLTELTGINFVEKWYDL